MKYHMYEHKVSKKGLLSMDANAICSLTFALSGILGASQDKCCHNIFLCSVLGCIAFVMPSPDIPEQTIDNIVIETIQKICLTYSTGLLLGGSMLLINKTN